MNADTTSLFVVLVRLWLDHRGLIGTFAQRKNEPVLGVPDELRLPDRVPCWCNSLGCYFATQAEAEAAAKRVREHHGTLEVKVVRMGVT